MSLRLALVGEPGQHAALQALASLLPEAWLVLANLSPERPARAELALPSAVTGHCAQAGRGWSSALPVGMPLPAMDARRLAVDLPVGGWQVLRAR